MSTGQFDESAVRKVFQAIDKTGRGSITVQELCQVMKRIGEEVTEADARVILSQADTKATGMITEDDFIKYMTSRSTDFHQLLRETFQAMDTKKTGFLTHAQLRAGFAKVGMKLSSEELEQMQSVVDTDKTGRISWEEFLRVTQ